MCGPTGICRLKPRPAKRLSLTSACHSARSASVGLRRNSRASPRTGARSFGTAAAVLGEQVAQPLRLLAVEHAAARRPFAALRQRSDDAVQRADILLRRRHAREDIAQVDAHGAALFLRAEELDLLELAFEIGKKRVELLLGRRRRFVRHGNGSIAAADAA